MLRQRLGRSWRSLPLQGRLPLIVSRQENNTQRIVALDEQAVRLRLKPGMGIADVRAMYPGIEVVAADPKADRRLLEMLADWCSRFTPLVALDGDDGLFLDITGCAHLFGGEAKMLDGILSGFLAQGFLARAGLASTVGTAWAASRFAAGHAMVAKGDEHVFMDALPLAALRLEPGVIASLESVGLRTVKAVADRPRPPLARRFGAILLLRLDQAFGEIEETISPRLPVPALSVERHLAEPIGSIDDIEGLLRLLAGSLKLDLERRGEGARMFELLLFRVDGAVTRISAGASLPLREAGPVCRLFHERLAALGAVLDPGYGFDALRLAAFDTVPLETIQTGFSGEDRQRSEDIALFADRVRARLGNAAILQPELAGSHLPERASRFVPFSGASGSPGLPQDDRLERPLRLFPHPEPIEVPVTEVPEGPPLHFRWRRVMHRVARAEGPERIAPEWWLHCPPEDEEKSEEAERLATKVATASLTRDYFRIEDDEGRRFWLYREGLYGRGLQPRWFMQGLFA